jgi:hypothetical protein
MKLRHLFVPLLLALPIPTAAALAGGGDQRSDAAVAASATAVFHDVERAKAAGYGELRDAAGIACISQPGVGTMGIHYVNGDFVGDTVLDAQHPEALVYEPEANGNLKLAALEYIVFQGSWDATHAQPPSLFGRQFDFTPFPNRFGIPAFYSLHAWIWKPNSAGLLEPFNPGASC